MPSFGEDESSATSMLSAVMPAATARFRSCDVLRPSSSSRSALSPLPAASAPKISTIMSSFGDDESSATSTLSAVMPAAMARFRSCEGGSAASSARSFAFSATTFSDATFFAATLSAALSAARFSTASASATAFSAATCSAATFSAATFSAATFLAAASRRWTGSRLHNW